MIAVYTVVAIPILPAATEMCSAARTRFYLEVRIQSDAGDTQAHEVLVRVVVERRRARRIRRVTRRDENDHSLSRAGQQDTIGVQQVALPVLLVNGRPRISPERLITPRVRVAP